MEEQGSMKKNQTFLRVNPAWNRMGQRYLSARFRKRFDALFGKQGFVLQFIPPRSLLHQRGVNPEIYPFGVWDVCKRLPRSGFLHPRVVWSLADTEGRPSLPGPDTLRLVRTALFLQRNDRVEEIEETIDKSIQAVKRAGAEKNEAAMRAMLRRYSSAYGTRQWTHKVSMRRKGRKERELRTV
jgi:hypothetical protein